MSAPTRASTTTPANEPGQEAAGRYAGTRKALALEVRRTGALWVAATMALVGAALLAFDRPPFQRFPFWSSTWADGAQWLSTVGLVLGPMVAGVGAWVAGRERRRHLEELLATTARPPAQRLLTTFSALSVAVALGYAGCAAVVIAAIAPAVSYAGGRWPAAWLLAGLGLVVCASVGWAAGRLVPGRLVPPLVAVALYVGSGVANYLSGQGVQLAPVGLLAVSGGLELVAWVIPAAIGWLLAVIAVAVMLTTGPRRWVALPVAVALALAVALIHVDTDEDPASSWARSDLGAQQLVCTPQKPVICLSAEHAGLLDQVAPLARATMADLAPLVSFERAVEVTDAGVVPPDALAIQNLQGRYQAFSGELADPSEVSEQAVAALKFPACDLNSPGMDQIGASAGARTSLAVAASLLHTPVAENEIDRAQALSARLSQDQAAARAWMSQYLTAARSCDVGALTQLGDQ